MSKLMKEIFVFYGSQTGQAQSIAESVHEDAIFQGIDCKLFCLKDEGKLFDITKIKLALFVCSTTGDGEPPENARPFVTKLQGLGKKGEKKLSSLRYALLGLGDSNYATFAGGPKTLHKALLGCGACSFSNPVYADDAGDQDEAVDEWMEGLWERVTAAWDGIVHEEALAKQILELKINKEKEAVIKPSLLENSALNDVALTLPPLINTYIELCDDARNEEGTPDIPDENDITVTVTSSTRLTSHWSNKNTVELIVEADENDDKFCAIDYQPGDSFAFVCPNSSNDVNYIISRLEVGEWSDVAKRLRVAEAYKGLKSLPPHLPTTAFTIRHLLTERLELRAFCKKSLLRALTEHTGSPVERRRLEELSSREGGQDHVKYVRTPNINITDILHNFPTCHPPVELLIQHLPALKRRSFSIASSPLIHRHRLRFVYSLVSIPAGRHRRAARLGVATGHLVDATPVGTRIRMRHRPSAGFRLPDDLRTPLIMIGPGTGVAPFVGFLEQRRQLAAAGEVLGEAHLYFGCRRPDEDFIFRAELETAVAGGDDAVLTSLNVAHSRPEKGGEGRYVQDVLREQAGLVVRLVIERGAVVYVCGDARGMSKDVRQCFVELFDAEMNGSGGKETMKRLVKERRYREDVWC